MSEKIALYAGSFDPPTLGHLDLIERASKIFDRLIVAVANNDQKTALLSVPERMELLRGMTRSMDRVEIDQFEGLTVEYAREKKAVALIRGLRVVSDFEFELSLAIKIRNLIRRWIRSASCPVSLISF